MKCIICGNEKLRRLRLIREYSRETKRYYPLFKCQSCGFIRPFPLPYQDKNKLKIYDSPKNIRFYEEETGRIERRSKEYLYYFKYFKIYEKFIKEYKIKGRSLDIGCGAGHLMILLKRLGLRAEGIEISPILIKALLKDNMKVYKGNLNDKIMRNKKYDFVIANQVLEHIENPQKFVDSMNKVMRNGAYAVISVPYINGLVPKILRTKWYGLGHGQHLNFFSEKSINMILKKSGFEIKEIKIDIVDYSHPSFPKIVDFIANFLSKIIVFTGLGDNMFIVAQKIREVKK